ncbi:ArgE/DapE family deacylase [Natrialbaceae archaeon A-CW2]|uniref:ArgE/DapE family deacylase n=1 Tax=Natronosalvus amylolyticus TaxID=2961994 RepID=UPI0020C98B0C|nr:ArgE/DapE family deacylase [Natronosalvus amylolyticus]
MEDGSLETTVREIAATLCSFETTGGNEASAQKWLQGTLESAGFDVYTWEGDAERLASHPSFPDDPALIDTDGRPSVGGVLEFGDPEAGKTLVLNGHVDVVPAGRGWEGDPFEPRWKDGRLTARGAADMKSGLAACVGAAKALESSSTEFDGRIVVESVVGEEEGGIGAAAAAIENPYPFDRDAAIVAEPTELRPVTATEGSLMVKIGLEGRSAHAATRWRGASVLEAFEDLRAGLEAFERERSERVVHPLYESYPIPWPVCIGRLEAGEWASSVADELTASVRVGVAPGETVASVERELRAHLEGVAREADWDGIAGPTMERFSIQFEPGVTESDEPVVRALQTGMERTGLSETSPRGVTYGADSRHYVAAGIPTVVFGPGSIEQAHFPEETIEWESVERATSAITEAAHVFLSS